VAATPREAVLDAEVVITVVSNDAALHEVAEGPDGFLADIAAGTVVLQMSTVGPDTTVWLDGEVRGRGGEMVDAPLLGSKPEAEAGMVGTVGQGTRLKLCNNPVVAGVVAAVAEGIALLEAGGVDPQQYIHILKGVRQRFGRRTATYGIVAKWRMPVGPQRRAVSGTPWPGGVLRIGAS